MTEFDNPMDGFQQDVMRFNSGGFAPASGGFASGGFASGGATATDTTVPQPEDFDYRRDIAPHASRLFGEISRDRRLSENSRRRLQGELIGTVDAIGERRAAIEKQRTASALDRIRLESSQLALLDARDRRARMQEDAGRMTDLTGRIDGLLRSDLPEDQKKQALAELEWENSDLVASDPRAARRFAIANRTINPPTPEKDWLTPDKITDLISKGIPPEVLATGDPVIIGQFLGAALEARKNQEAAESEMVKDNAVLRRKISDLLSHSFRTIGSDEDPDVKILPQDTRARAIEAVTLFGTEDNKEELAMIPETPEGDRHLAALATIVQMQQRLRLLERNNDPAGALAEDLVPD